MQRMGHALVGVIALALLAGAVVLTGMFLTGSIKGARVEAAAEFSHCGQGLRVGGDVKLRGVLVGRISEITLTDEGACHVGFDLFPEGTDQIPANVGAQIRAKTVFGEKWVELLYPKSPSDERFGEGDFIASEDTIDPLEVETILDIGLPLLDAIDPEQLAAALDALAEGFVGQEKAAIRGIDDGIKALEPLVSNEDLLRKGIGQFRDATKVLEEVDDDLLAALDNLDDLNRFTAENAGLLAESLEKTPEVLNELGMLFETRFDDLTRLVDRGATVIGVLAARSDDIDRLLTVLPKFNSGWIRNLDHVCRYRQLSDEPGKSVGDRVPGRCWRVHNVLSHSRGAYGSEEEEPDRSSRRGGKGLSSFFPDAEEAGP